MKNYITVILAAFLASGCLDNNTNSSIDYGVQPAGVIHTEDTSGYTDNDRNELVRLTKEYLMDGEIPIRLKYSGDYAVVGTDADTFGMASPMANFFFQKINNKWVIVGTSYEAWSVEELGNEIAKVPKELLDYNPYTDGGIVLSSPKPAPKDFFYED